LKPELQAKLLRVLEEHKLRRLGGTVEIEIDVRVLAATNRNLETAIKERRLRENLYYRLNVFEIELPPLRQHPEDIPALVEHFLHTLEPPEGKIVTGVDAECLEALKSQRWPGNVRQLRNAIAHALVITPGSTLTVADLPADSKCSPARIGINTALNLQLGISLGEAKRELIIRTLEFTGGNKSQAAQILGLSLKTLYHRLEAYRLKEDGLGQQRQYFPISPSGRHGNFTWRHRLRGSCSLSHQ
jgi:two-component system, NtrC family, response regulator HydG